MDAGRQQLSNPRRRPRPETDDESSESESPSSKAASSTKMLPPHTPAPTRSSSRMPESPQGQHPRAQQQTPQLAPEPLIPGSPSLYSHLLCYLYSVHEGHSINSNLPVAPIPDTNSLIQRGMPPSEAAECHTYRHSFPHVPQPGQYYHLTQIPRHANIDTTTVLSLTYQIVIRFDTNYRDVTKQDAQEAAVARL
jgi:hypothetical protein